MTELPTYPAERKALHKALAQAQGEFPPIPKDQDRRRPAATPTPTPTSPPSSPPSGPSSPNTASRSSNASRIPNGQPAIRTELLHADGAAIAASFPLGDLPQNLATARIQSPTCAATRSSPCSGIAAEEDDDGRTGAGAEPGTRRPRPLAPTPNLHRSSHPTYSPNQHPKTSPQPSAKRSSPSAPNS